MKRPCENRVFLCMKSAVKMLKGMFKIVTRKIKNIEIILKNISFYPSKKHFNVTKNKLKILFKFTLKKSLTKPVFFGILYIQ